MASKVEEAIEVSEGKLTESAETVNFSKQANRNPGKFNIPKHRKLKLKRQLVRQNNKKRHDSCFKRKNENSKLSRKRLHHGKFFTTSYKRRKKEHQVIIPPTKFLLGGNICDPLNLNSLQDEETNRAVNAVTPISSPKPTPKHGEIEVLIPRNMKDPLNLISCTDDNECKIDSKLMIKRSRKHRHRKRKRGSSGSGSGKDESNEVIFTNIQDENVEPCSQAPAEMVGKVEREPGEKPVMVEAAVTEKAPEKPTEVAQKPANPKRDSLSLSIKENPRHSGHRTRKIDDKDKIVSPVIPQPGAWKKPRPSPMAVNRKKKDEKMPEFKPKNTKYQYGNYDRYYGYRNPHHEIDIRLRCFMEHKELFFDKDILDIGCNIGHITLCVARDLGARSAVGLDIDRKLINIARKNVKHYVNVAPTPAYSGGFSIRNAPPFESPMYFDNKKNYQVFQDSPSMNPRATPLYSYPESPVTRNSHQYCMESPSYTPSGKNTPYYSMESPSYHPSISESPSYRRNYAFESPSYVQQSPSYHSGRNTPLYSLESPSYQSHCSLDQKRSPQDAPVVEAVNKSNCDKLFPISMPILYGPVDPPGISTQQDSNNPKTFPHNVTFVHGNYVLESDVLLSAESPQFDVILALSITKWIHLNWGDAGIKQAFRRMFEQLRPGGILILETQAWPSYKKKKKLTKTIYHNYCNIEFMPDQFTQYLLSPEVGFSKVDVIGTPQHRAKGFQRPIQVFTKPGSTPSQSTTPMSRSTPSQVRYTPYSQRMCVRRPVYTALTVSSHEMDEDVSLSPKQAEFPAPDAAAAKVKFSPPTSAEPCGPRSDVPEGCPKVATLIGEPEDRGLTGKMSPEDNKRLLKDNEEKKVECQ
ncbi:hypothetical protein RUM44_006301 [Polyplax serrata]|uniref:RNA methyltransferase n=1 Tax=Polyplax serrata TaxID=468196 RepID=A0ABR1AHQ3_POLSC